MILLMVYHLIILKIALTFLRSTFHYCSLVCKYMVADPAGLLLSTLVPLIQNKRGNKCDSNNYRAIAIITSSYNSTI